MKTRKETTSQNRLDTQTPLLYSFVSSAARAVAKGVRCLALWIGMDYVLRTHLSEGKWNNNKSEHEAQGLNRCTAALQHPTQSTFSISITTTKRPNATFETVWVHDHESTWYDAEAYFLGDYTPERSRCPGPALLSTWIDQAR